MILQFSVQKIFSFQAVLVSAMAGLFYVYQGELAAQAAFYGGGIVILNLWLSSRRLLKVLGNQNTSPNQEVLVLYVAAAQRFILTLGLFILGMGVFKLPPIPLLIGFAVTQVTYFFSLLWDRK